MEVGRSWKAEQLFVGFTRAVFKYGETSIKRTPSGSLNCPLNRGCLLNRGLTKLHNVCCTRMTIIRPDIDLICRLLTAKYIDLSLFIDYSTFFKDVIQYYYCQFSPVSA